MKHETKNELITKGVALMEIYINGKKKPWVSLSITYEQVVMLAFGTPEVVMNYTVTYSKGEDNKQGSMIRGDKVKASMNMIFNVTRTNNA
jgi:hypothetical protein